MNLCYLCGNHATKPLKLADSFTAHSAARVPTSSKMCDRCSWAIPLRCFYSNEAKGKWSKLFARNWSWLFAGDKLISPIIEGEHTEGKDTLPIVKSLATRAEIREWLINPPQPPFTIAIAESGQKHILPWARSAESREVFPVQFELDTVYVNCKDFIIALNNYEQLMTWGFSKTEIDSGDYRSDRLMGFVDNAEFWEIDKAIALLRGSRSLQLISYVGKI